MKFSIVLTATRPHYLEHSLRAALAQTFSDYEIVVSDNSTDGCRDVVERLGGDRVRYVRAEERLPVVAHWDFAFAQACGDWQLQLCDDDAITPNLLAVLDSNIEKYPDVQVICWNYGVYRSKNHWLRPGYIGVGQFSGKATRYEAKYLLRQMFDSGSGLFRVKSRIPFFPRTACRRDALDAIRARQGHLFHKICPMTSGAVAMLAFADKVLHLDLPLTLLGSSSDSAGGWVANPTALLGHLTGTDIELAPIKLSRILPSGEAESMLRTQRAMPERMEGLQVNYVNYFLHCTLFLKEAEANGADVAAWWKVVDDALATMPDDVQANVREAVARDAANPKPSFYQQARHKLRSALEPLLPPRLPGETKAIRLGLRDIFDCAVYVGGIIDSRRG